MKTVFLASFARDLRKVPEARVREQIKAAIFIVEEALDLCAESGLKKLSGSSPYFRLRVGITESDSE